MLVFSGQRGGEHGVDPDFIVHLITAGGAAVSECFWFKTLWFGHTNIKVESAHFIIKLINKKRYICAKQQINYKVVKLSKYKKVYKQSSFGQLKTTMLIDIR